VAVGAVEKCPNIVRDFLVGMNTGKSHFSYIRVTPGDIGVALIHHACSLLIHGQCLRGYQCCMGSCRVVRTLGRPPLERFGTGGRWSPRRRDWHSRWRDSAFLLDV
jgi:hypothetical protein